MSLTLLATEYFVDFTKGTKGFQYQTWKFQLEPGLAAGMMWRFTCM
jgi:hypothetical protein